MFSLKIKFNYLHERAIKYKTSFYHSRKLIQEKERTLNPLTIRGRYICMDQFLFSKSISQIFVSELNSNGDDDGGDVEDVDDQNETGKNISIFFVVFDAESNEILYNLFIVVAKTKLPSIFSLANYASPSTSVVKSSLILGHSQ